jgi:hypothetical protein
MRLGKPHARQTLASRRHHGADFGKSGSRLTAIAQISMASETPLTPSSNSGSDAR